MASVWLALTVLFYMGAINSALPVRNPEQDYEVFGFIAEKKSEESELDPHRAKRAVLVDQQDPSGMEPGKCKNGELYYVVIEKVCTAEDSSYNGENNLCLVLIAYVPTMPDGKKGSNYLTMNHHLYRFYTPLSVPIRKDCPKTTTTQTPSTTQASTTPTLSTKATLAAKKSSETTSSSKQETVAPTTSKKQATAGTTQNTPASTKAPTASSTTLTSSTNVLST